MNGKSKSALLNPFAFPAETEARFWLFFLSVAFLGIWIISNLPALLFGSVAEYWENAYQAINADFDLTSPQVREILRQQIIMGTIIPITLFVWIIILWYLTKFYYQKQIKNILIDTDAQLIENEPKNQVLFDQIKELAEKAEIPVPELYISKKIPDGRAFGDDFEQKIIIGNKIALGLKMPHTQNRSRALILHEMGHIANKDVYRALMSSSLWKVVERVIFPLLIVLIIISFLVGVFEKAKGGFDSQELSRIFTVNIPVVLKELVALLGTYLFFLMMYSSILRIREYFADWRAGLWGERQTLIEIIKESPNEMTNNWLDEIKNQWKKANSIIIFVKVFIKKTFQKYHPSSTQRVEALLNPSVLYYLKPELSILVGFCLSIIMLGANFILQIANYFYKFFSYFIILLTPNSANLVSLSTRISIILAIYYLSFLIFSFIFLRIGKAIFNTIGLQLQKDVIAQLSKNGSYSIKKLIYPAFFLTIGLELGRWFTPLGFAIIGFTVDDLIKLILINICVFFLNVLWLGFVQKLTVELFAKAQNKINSRYRFLSFFASFLMMALYFFIFLLKISAVNWSMNEVFLWCLGGSVAGILAVIILYLIALASSRFIFPQTTKCLHCNAKLTNSKLLGKCCVECNSMYGSELWILANIKV